MNNHIQFGFYKKKIRLFLLAFMQCCFFSVQAQKIAELQVKAVFNQLVNAYGSSKSAPELIFMKETPKPETPALYIDKKIKVDLQLYQLCRSFGKDSLNALSIVISHELAHYYYDHDFCSDFAYAIKNKNVQFSNGLKLINKNQKVIYETQADNKGLFYCAIAGYTPFEIQPQLLDAIYNKYNLKDENIGYPSKTERKQIAENALKKVSNLYLVFQKGLKFKAEKKYTEAIAAFEEVNNYFPSRENYNNIGVVKTLQALELKILTSEEYNYPKRFLYPLEIDNSSRLQQNGTRSSNDKQEQMTSLLKSAQKDFEKAISLDPVYTKSYINLACVFDLLDNPEAAIGKIKELPVEKQIEIDAQRILAIAYYHADNDKKAKEIWKLLKI